MDGKSLKVKKMAVRNPLEDLTIAGDYQGIANALWVLVEDAKKRNRFGRRSKEILSLNYNMEIFGQRYLDVVGYQ